MKQTIALVGNPNSGKTTLFNQLTKSNQNVGNWPGVTVEKKEGFLVDRKDVIVVDLPGIYSLSPYSLEEVVARNYLVHEKPDVILNIVDGTNLERNLYLSTQLLELGIPMILAVNLMDVVRKNCDFINIAQIGKDLGVPIIEISALKDEKCLEAAELALKQISKKVEPATHFYTHRLESTLIQIEQKYLTEIKAIDRRWYAIKLFERDKEVVKELSLRDDQKTQLEQDIQNLEQQLEDDSESILTNERYLFITRILRTSYCKGCLPQQRISSKIDRFVTHRLLAFPIFLLTMFLIYFISITTVGTWVTDWTNDGLFGEGYHVFNIGSHEYKVDLEAYQVSQLMKESFEETSHQRGIEATQANDLIAVAKIFDEHGTLQKTLMVTHEDYLDSLHRSEPLPQNYGIYFYSIPAILDYVLTGMNVSPWLQSLVIDGIVGGVGAVLGFVPQMAVLFLLLAILETSGYMARIAFVLDRIFKRFGLSGKSFIPMMIGTGCSVPGIVASRTIENESDRRITIMTTSFMPCSAKLPIIALIAGTFFHGSWWVAFSAYLIGIVMILLSGIILKKTKLLAGDTTPFVMELPDYRMPKLNHLLRSVREKTWSFISKASTIILVSSVVLWFLMRFGYQQGIVMVDSMEASFLASIGQSIAWIFDPLGFGFWQASVATFTGLIAKENVVGTFGVLFNNSSEVIQSGSSLSQSMTMVFTPLAAYSFLVFNLLCTPCFAAVSAIAKEMNSRKFTIFALIYQVGLAYSASFIFYQFALALSGQGSVAGVSIAVSLMLIIIYFIVRPDKFKAYRLLMKGSEA